MRKKQDGDTEKAYVYSTTRHGFILQLSSKKKKTVFGWSELPLWCARQSGNTVHKRLYVKMHRGQHRAMPQQSSSVPSIFCRLVVLLHCCVRPCATASESSLKDWRYFDYLVFLPKTLVFPLSRTTADPPAKPWAIRIKYIANT